MAKIGLCVQALWEENGREVRLCSKKKNSSFFFRDITLSVTGQRSAVVRRPSILQAPHHPVRLEMVHKECRFWVISGSPSAHT